MTRSRGKQLASRDPTYESRIQAAIQGITTGLYKSIKAAAEAQEVKRQTLSDRYSGLHKSRCEAQVKKQILTPTQEQTLADWCNHRSATATPLHPKILRAHAFNISGRTPGKNWHYGFLRRHDTLFLSKPRGLDPKRGQNFNKATVGEFFEMRKELDDKYEGIPPEHHWNMDEKGNQMGGGRKNDGSKFIHSEDDPDCYRMHSDNLELVTIIECVSAAGAKMPPWFVLSNGPVPDIRDLKGQVSGVATSPSGWTDQEIAEKWFADVFVPEAEKHRVNDKPIVLTLDGHNSHETDAIKKAAYKNGVIVHAFPSKTTHKLQPLDVGVFSSVQRAWTKHCDSRLVEGVEIDRYNFIHEYMSIHHVITPELVQKAFRKTGLYPLNPNVFTDRDFAPSMVSSSTAHLPPSYPAEVPSSPILGPSDDEDLDYVPMEVEDSEESGEESGEESELDASPRNDIVARTPASCQIVMGASHNAEMAAPFVFAPESPMNLHSESPATEPPDDAAMPAATAISTPPDAATSHRVTRSISPPTDFLPTPVIPSYAHAMSLTKEELWMELQRMYNQNKALLDTIGTLTAQLQAANAHCTIAQRELSTSRLELANQKTKKRKKSTKLRARFVTLPELEEDFNKDEAERREKEKADTEKQVKKKNDDDARQLQIANDIATKTFDAALSSYKRKDDLITIAGALQLSRDGNIAELMARIKCHVTDPANSELANNPRFSALIKGKSRAKNSSDTGSASHIAPSPNHSTPPIHATNFIHPALSTSGAVASNFHPIMYPLGIPYQQSHIRPPEPLNQHSNYRASSSADAPHRFSHSPLHFTSDSHLANYGSEPSSSNSHRTHYNSAPSSSNLHSVHYNLHIPPHSPHHNSYHLHLNP